MKFIKFGVAFLATLAMLHIARNNSRGHPELLTHTDGPYTFEMTSVPKIAERQSDTITVSVTGPIQGKTVVFRTSQRLQIDPIFMDDFDRITMDKSADKPNEYGLEIKAGDRGGRFYYYFEVADSSGAELARFAQENRTPFLLKYIGEVPIAVLLGHLVFIFATVFFVALATVEGIGVIRGGDIRPMSIYLFGAVFACFMGGYPLGIPMNYFAFNGGWEGVPFGTDATDNKTQLLLIYLLFAALTTLGSLSKGRLGRDLFAPVTRGWIGVSTFAVMMFIYLIPHSIQFSAGFTKMFCYSWIAVVVILYMLGLTKSRAVSS